MLNILFWGTGSKAANWLQSNLYRNDLFRYINKIKFIDRNHAVGTQEFFFRGKFEMIAPEEIAEETYDFICILSSFEKEIKEEIIAKYGIGEDKIINDITIYKKVVDTIGVNHFTNHLTKGLKIPENRILALDFLSDDAAFSVRMQEYLNYRILKEQLNIPNPSDFNLNHEDLEHKTSKIIWTCWLQGYDAAPDIVKACIQSIKKLYGTEYEIHVVEESTIGQYIQMPEFVLEKYKAGKISHAFFSDLLRTELLVKYGGIWIDATVLLTAQIPKAIANSDLFLFTIAPNTTPIPVIDIRSWFIVATQGNPVLRFVKELFYQYVKKNDVLSDYYLVYHFFAIAKEAFSYEWGKMVHFDIPEGGKLRSLLFSPFDQETWDMLTNISFCHKLTYRNALPSKIKGTFYEHILKEFSK